ncbi:SRPBCC family protein [Cesiribacter sp. SM1]|uniref:SRPBCC family protein n=1 Tax=Cesiribacter sp. SM1 TaxID=2861196 RepID=UPI001CD3B8C4|nr:SRPBCC family protein [Cesiribacter sp. SM1]
MKIIRGVALVLAGVMILALIAAAFMPETLRVERSIVINRPVDEVFDQVADLNNWLAWNPWSELDPEAVNEISTPSRGRGAQWTWEGDKIGKGHLVQEEIEEDKMVRFTLAFEEPMQSTGTDLWQFDSLDSRTTRVVWADEMALDYPVGRLSALFIGPAMEEQFDKGLMNLKRLLESQRRVEPAPAAPAPINDTAVIQGT